MTRVNRSSGCLPIRPRVRIATSRVLSEHLGLLPRIQIPDPSPTVIPADASRDSYRRPFFFPRHLLMGLSPIVAK